MMILKKFRWKVLAGSFFKHGQCNIGHAFGLCLTFIQLKIRQPQWPGIGLTTQFPVSVLKRDDILTITR